MYYWLMKLIELEKQAITALLQGEEVKYASNRRIIKGFKGSVFFIDDNQIVRPNEIGSVEYIKDYAEKIIVRFLNMNLKLNLGVMGPMHLLIG